MCPVIAQLTRHRPHHTTMDSKRKANGTISMADELDDRGAKRRKVSVSPAFARLFVARPAVGKWLRFGERWIAMGNYLPMTHGVHLGPSELKRISRSSSSMTNPTNAPHRYLSGKKIYEIFVNTFYSFSVRFPIMGTHQNQRLKSGLNCYIPLRIVEIKGTGISNMIHNLMWRLASLSDDKSSESKNPLGISTRGH